MVNPAAKTMALRDGDVFLFLCSFVRRRKRALVGQWSGPAAQCDTP